MRRKTGLKPEVFNTTRTFWSNAYEPLRVHHGGTTLNQAWKLRPEPQKLPELQRATIASRLSVHEDQQALVNRLVKRTQPSLHHLKAREQMYFPGLYRQSLNSGCMEHQQRKHGQLSVHLPPLPTKTKSSQNVVSAPGLPRQPFVSQNCWEDEYSYECKLMRIPFFAVFKKWKPFYMWRTYVRTKKFNLARESMKKNLFFVSQSLGPALIDIRKMCCQISDTGLCDWERKRNCSLREFLDNQFKQLQEVLSDLKKFQGFVKEVTMSACDDFLLDHQYKNDQTDDPNAEKVLMQITMHISFTRITCFIRLVDYLVINTLQSLVVNSVTKLLSVVNEHISQTLSHGIIQGRGHHSEAKPAEEGTDRKISESETSGVQPVYISEQMLDTKTFKPTEEDFMETFAEILGWYEKPVMSFNTLVEDPDTVTQLLSYKKLTGTKEGTCLKSLDGNDFHLQRLNQYIKESLQFTFKAAKEYSSMSEHSLLSYRENNSRDLDNMQEQDHINIL